VTSGVENGRGKLCIPARRFPVCRSGTLAQAFTASFQQVQWIVLAHLLASTTLIVSVGRLGDLTGR